MAKKIWIGVLVVILLFGTGAVIYRLIKTQGVVEAYTINEDVNDVPRVLIATQQKGFKDHVMEAIKETYTGEHIFIQVMDVTALPDVRYEDWDYVVLFTTIQSSRLLKQVRDFLDQSNHYENAFMLLTADSGGWNRNTYDIDTVTMASRKSNEEEAITLIKDAIDTCFNHAP